MQKRTHKVFEYDYTAENEAVNFDPLTKMFELGDTMAINARAMRKQAVSYRGVLVGSAVLAHNVEEQKLRVYVGFNNTPFKGAPKYCAEMKAIHKAEAHGYGRTEAVFTAGPSDPDVIESIVGVPVKILPPCEPCRGLNDDATVVISLGGEENIYGVHTGEQLKGRHLLGSLIAARRRSSDKTTPHNPEPVYDLAAVNWAQASEHYQDLTAQIKPEQFEYVDDLRLARAAAAVTVLTCGPLAGQ
jgi:cytidine deaminase